MTTKTIAAFAITLVGAVALIYAGIAELSGNAPLNQLFGVIYIGVFIFMAGAIMLRNVYN